MSSSGRIGTSLFSGSSPPTTGLRLRVGALVAATGLITSCAGDMMTPTQPTDESAEVAPAVKDGERNSSASALTVGEMLGDPLFRASLGGVAEPSLQLPLLEAVKALELGRHGEATQLIIEAQAEARTLLDDTTADLESLISWAVLERFFEEAELV